MAQWKALFDDFLAPAGITLDGSHPWDPQILDSRFYLRVAQEGTLGLGEAYLEGWWECADLEGFFCRALSAPLTPSPQLLIALLGAKVTKWWHRFPPLESYRLDADFFKTVLDRRLVYSCGYWKGEESLDDAQENKLDLICRKLQCQKGQRLLDVGCGWGSFAKFAAEKYGVEVVGIDLAEEPVRYGREACKGRPVEFRIMDYADLREEFDHIVCTGTFPHLKNLRRFFKAMRGCLKQDGLMLIHTIGSYSSKNLIDPFVNKYWLENAYSPSLVDFARGIEDLFVVEDWQVIDRDYRKMGHACLQNFEKNREFLERKYDVRFSRMFRYMTSAAIAAAIAGKVRVWQVVLSKNGVPSGYTSVR